VEKRGSAVVNTRCRCIVTDGNHRRPLLVEFVVTTISNSYSSVNNAFKCHTVLNDLQLFCCEYASAVNP
jgi:hypothetical protein